MNFKKFISGVSALAIAASAFAGMAVTANAEDSNATLNVVADTYVNSNSDYRTTNYGSEESILVNSADNQLTNTSSPGLKNPTKVGLFKFDYSAYKDYTITSATLYFYAKNANGDNKGANVNFCRLTDDNWDESTVTYSSQSWTYRGSGTQFVTPNDSQYVDNDQTTYKKYSVDISNMFGASADSDGTLSLAAYCGTAREQAIASKETTETNISGAYIDIVYSTSAISADSLTISYTCGGSQVASDYYDLSGESLYVGGTYDYIMPAYVTDSSNNLYRVNVSSYYATASLTAANTTVPVTCTSLGTTGAFYDINDKTYGGDGTYLTGSKLSGNTAARHLGANYGSPITVTAPSAGVYNVTVCGLTNSYNATEVLNVYKNSVSEDNLKDTIATQYRSVNSPVTQSVQVALNEGDKIIVKASGDNAAVDYVLLEKVGDIASAELNETVNTYDTYDDPTVKAYTFDATPKKIGSEYQALNSVTVTVKVDGYEDRVQTKTADEFGTFSGPVTFAILIGGNVTPTAINVAVD